jgi:dTMP kinase
LAYQGAGQGLAYETWSQLSDLTLEGLQPDLTLILDLPVAAGLARAAGRSAADRYEKLGADFHARIRAGFQEIARRNAERCVVLDAARDAESVYAAISETLRQRLGAPL